MKDKRVLLWFKNELRLLDNEILFRAAAKATFVLPIYIIDTAQFQPGKLGFPKTGYFRTQFLLESLTALKSSLQEINADLHVFVGRPEDIIPQLVKQLKITAVYASQEVGSEELAIQSAIELQLEKFGVPIELSWQNTLYHADDIPWPIYRLPDTFTNFRKEVEQESSVRKIFSIPEIAYRQEIESLNIPLIQNFGFSSQIKDTRGAIQFKGGEQNAQERLQEYFWEKDLLRTYKETRNELLGSDYSSKFSAWLALGCISPRTIYNEVKRYEQERVKNDSTYWLIFELLWRDYFRFAAKKFGVKIFQRKGIRNKAFESTNNADLFEKWRHGKTGVDFIDANMRELLHTGFMSNRGRQNVASFLAKDYKVNWTWGAAWFESQLVDYDVSSNWLNWAYIAGVGNDPREDRYFNTESQVRKYDPKGEYVRHWLSNNIDVSKNTHESKVIS